MIAALLAFLSTIAASVIHGGDYLRKKIIVMGLHTILLAGSLYLSGVRGYWLGLAVPVMLIYWFMFRRGIQAHAEMQDMANIGKPVKTWQAYLLPCGITAGVSLALFVLAREWLLIPLVALPFTFLWVPPFACRVGDYGNHAEGVSDEDKAFQRKQRMKVEALVGFAPSGLAIGILVYAVGVYYGK